MGSTNDMAEREVRICPSKCKPLVVGDVTYRSVYDWTVTELDLDIAYQELNETKTRREMCLRKLRIKLEKNSELLHPVDDHYLLCYLRFRKLDIERAEHSIRTAHSMRRNYPEYFILPPNLKELFDRKLLNWLPYKDDGGSYIFWQRFGQWKLDEMSLHDGLRLGHAMMDLAVLNPACQINGIVGIWDFRGFNMTMRQVTLLINPKLAWFFIKQLQDCYPVRVKVLLLINCNGIVKTVLNSCKFFLKKKISDRIQLLDDIRDIQQHLNPNLLPKGLGGTIEDDECSITDHVMDNLPYLKYIRCKIPPSDISSERNETKATSWS